MLRHRVALSQGSTLASVVSFPLMELLTPLRKQLRLHFCLPGLSLLPQPYSKPLASPLILNPMVLGLRSWVLSSEELANVLTASSPRK